MFGFLTAMGDHDWLSLAMAILARVPLLVRTFARVLRRGNGVVRQPRQVLVVVVIWVESPDGLVLSHYAVLAFTSAA